MPSSQSVSRARLRPALLVSGIALVAVVAALAVNFLVPAPEPVTDAASAREGARVDASLESLPVATPATDAAPTGSSFSLVWVGDMMIGSTTPFAELPPDDAAGIFGAVAGLLDADLVTGNLEGPLTDAGPTSKCDGSEGRCFLFTQPPRYAERYKAAGFDIVNFANNHTFDRGGEGRRQTLAHLDAAGVLHAGASADDIARTDVNGTRVAALGYHWSTNSPEDVAEQVAAAAADNDVVIVFFHGGTEGEQGTHVEKSFVDFAHTAVDAGADAVLGSGPHVLRGIEFYNGRPVAYSLGNFATYGKFSIKGKKGESAVLRLVIGPDGSFESGRIDAVRLVGEGVPKPGGTGVATIRTLSEADFGTAGAQVADDGTISAPSG